MIKNKGFKFSIISDMHFGAYGYSQTLVEEELKSIEKDIDVLFIAGDIITHIEDKKIMDNLFKLLENLSYEVFVVLGNHEYYGLNFTDTKAYEDIFKPYQTIHLLRNNNMVWKGVNLIGTTLWTPARFTISCYMNDIRFVKDVHLAEEKYYDNLKFIEQAYDKSKKNIVITHHAPSKKSTAGKYLYNTMNKFFVNDIDENLIGKYDYWLHGHTHDVFKYEIGKCKIICNPVGYKHEKTGWKMEVFEI